MPRNDSALPPDAAHLQGPLSRLLLPLVRLAIRCGVTFPAFCDLLRELYVHIAETEFALSEKPQTDSRVSLLTGIHRKEVHRLRNAATPISVAPNSLSRTSRIIAHWLAEPAYLDLDGQPLPLPRTGESGTISFETLVSDVTRDVRPRAVLDEWLDRGVVREDAEGRIVLSEVAFVPKGGDSHQLHYFGRNLHDHMAAAVANVLSPEPPFMERAVHYDGLSEDLSRQLVERSRHVAMDALRSLNREAHRALHSGAENGDWRWNFGVYVYRERVSPEPSVPDTTGGSDA